MSTQAKRFSEAFLDRSGRHEAAQFGQQGGLAFGRTAHLPGSQSSIDDGVGYAIGFGRLLDISLDGLGNDAELSAVVGYLGSRLGRVEIQVGSCKRRFDQRHANSELAYLVVQPSFTRTNLDLNAPKTASKIS